jgi:GNAT superfamily N-acetyltransferase
MPREDELKIGPADPECADAAWLLVRLERELQSRYGDDGKSDFLPAHVRVAGGVFLVGWFGDRPVGCGALRPMAHCAVEVKRMYVEPDMRGCGIGNAILACLEAFARKAGYFRIRLETEVRQPDAIHLYERAGYGRIENYGKYVGNPLSVCFEKVIARSTDEAGVHTAS